MSVEEQKNAARRPLLLYIEIARLSFEHGRLSRLPLSAVFARAEVESCI